MQTAKHERTVSFISKHALLSALFINLLIICTYGHVQNQLLDAELKVARLLPNRYQVSFRDRVKPQTIVIVAELNDNIMYKDEKNAAAVESDISGKPGNEFSVMRTTGLFAENEDSNDGIHLTATEYCIHRDANQLVHVEGIIRLTVSKNIDGTWNVFGIVIPTEDDSEEVHEIVSVEIEQNQWVYVENDANTAPMSCGTNIHMKDKGKVDRFNPLERLSNAMMAMRTKNSVSKLVAGCPTERKVVYVGVVADCSYVAKFPSMTACKTEIIKQWGIASGIYEKTFNISLCILSLTILKDCSTPTSSTPFNRECLLNYRIEQRLSDFSRWRDTQTGDAAIYHLMTGCPTNSVHGIAWLNQACSSKATRDREGNWINGTSVSVKTPHQYTVIAHEIGHNFGATHDCNEEACSIIDRPMGVCTPCGNSCDCRDRFIMSPESAGHSLLQFSPSSVYTICSLMPFKQRCVMMPGTMKTAVGPICGNGVKEDGEECDCGDEESCAKDPCCDINCKLKPGAACSDINDACCRSCQIIPKNEKKVCNTGYGVCMKDAICDGVNSSCPPVPTLANGTHCNTHEVLETDSYFPMCASGFCTSKDMQCRALNTTNFGSYIGSCPGKSTACTLSCLNVHNQCYQFNSSYLDGTSCGNSGFCSDGVCVGASVGAYISDYWEFFLIFFVLIFAVLILIILWMLQRAARAHEEREREETNQAARRRENNLIDNEPSLPRLIS